nr:TlpA disulfide reductase family protein [uncultured Psychroserpens sp.]
MKNLILMLLFVCGTTCQIAAQDVNALSILKKTNDQLNQNKTLQYNYTYIGWGKNNGRFSGTAYIDKNAGLQLGVRLKTLDDKKNIVLDEFIFTNGDQLKLLDKTNKVLKTGSASKGSSYLMSYAWYAVFREFLMPNALSMNFQNETIKYEGSKIVNGIDCHLVSYINQWGDTNIWYIGKKDHQIYGQKVENKNPETEGGFEFIMTSAKFNHSIDPNVFKISSKGVKIIDEDSRTIAPGEKAPEWALGNSDKVNVSSRQLLGKIVLLDFWASWCSPCWQIMPTINKIKTDYKQKNLAVYGINVWENPKLNLKEYLNKKGLNTYENLFDTDASVAKSFKIASLPLVVLIDENGTILYINNGMDTDMDKNIRKILDNR